MKLNAILACTVLMVGSLGHAQAETFSLSSPTFSATALLPQAHVLNGFGCNGGNRSPAISWRGAPEGTKSYAITLYDPDAPTGSGWWHWVVFDIPAQVQELPEDAGNTSGLGLPNGAIQGRTDFGRPGYGGVCPPAGMGTHRYILTIHAIKVEKLPVPSDATAAMIGFMINMNRLGSAVLEANFGR